VIRVRLRKNLFFLVSQRCLIRQSITNVACDRPSGQLPSGQLRLSDRCVRRPRGFADWRHNIPNDPVQPTSNMELSPENLLYVTQEVGVGGSRTALEHGSVQHSITQVPPTDPRASQAAV